MGKISSKQRNEKNLERLKNMPYNEYLQTNHYLRLARNVKKRDNNTCQICEIEKVKGDSILLNAHHKTYENRGDYDKEINDMITLCSACHIIEHGFTALSQFIECSRCEQEYRILNLTPMNSGVLKEEHFQKDYFENGCMMYKCPFCEHVMAFKIDIYNIQRLFKINNVKTFRRL